MVGGDELQTQWLVVAVQISIKEAVHGCFGGGRGNGIADRVGCTCWSENFVILKEEIEQRSIKNQRQVRELWLWSRSGTEIAILGGFGFDKEFIVSGFGFRIESKLLIKLNPNRISP